MPCPVACETVSVAESIAKTRNIVKQRISFRRMLHFEKVVTLESCKSEFDASLIFILPVQRLR